MRRKLKKLTLLFGAVIAALLLFGLALRLAVRTAAFRSAIERRAVAALEEATGGRVELGRLQFRWRPFVFEADHLVIHGREAPGAAPLLTADSVFLRPRLTSFFSTAVDIASITIQSPRAHLQIEADGSTNLPPGDRNPVRSLFNLRVGRVQVNSATILVDGAGVPAPGHAEGVDVSLASNLRLPQYRVQLSARAVSLDTHCCSNIRPQVTAAAMLTETGLSVSKLLLLSTNASLEGSGTLGRLAHPEAAFRFRSAMSAPELAAAAGVPGVREGALAVTGSLHYTPRAGLIMNGLFELHAAAYASPTVHLTHVNASSRFELAQDTLAARDLAAEMDGAGFRGRLTLNHWRSWEAEGQISAPSIARLAALIDRPAPPYNAALRGQLRAAGEIAGPEKREPFRDLAIQSKLNLSPAPGAIPVSGFVEIAKAKNAPVQFASSYLETPHSRLEFSGSPGETLELKARTSDSADFIPLAAGFHDVRFGNSGSASFVGKIQSALASPLVVGRLLATDFALHGQSFERAQAQLSLSSDGLDWQNGVLQTGALHATARGHIDLQRWQMTDASGLRLRADASGVAVGEFLSRFVSAKLPVKGGAADFGLDLSGKLTAPAGTAHLLVREVVLNGEPVQRMETTLVLAGNEVRVTRGRLQSEAGALTFAGAYLRSAETWSDGALTLRVDSPSLQMEKTVSVRSAFPNLASRLEIHALGSAVFNQQGATLTRLNGTAVARRITAGRQSLGDLSMRFTTLETTLEATLSGDLRSSGLSGTAQVQLVPGNPVSADLRFGRIELPALYELLASRPAAPAPFSGHTRGAMQIRGSLEHLATAEASFRLDEFELSPAISVAGRDQGREPLVVLRNESPIVLEAKDGLASIRSFRLAGNNTKLNATGSFGFLPGRPFDLKAEGAVDLGAFQMFDANLQSSGAVLLNASVSGDFGRPLVNGSLAVTNGSLFSRNLPNGLSNANGTITFDGERATIQELTAQTGGGKVSVSGFVMFGSPGPLVYHLEAQADDVRVRYANGISISADAVLRLGGTSASSLLSGSATISRVVFNPNTDVGNVLAAFSEPTPTPANQKDFLTGLHLDVGIESAPNLQLSTALSRDVEAEIDLRLRGTPDRPVLTGSVSANQGDIRVFGTRYSINRGEISFLNTIKIDPVLDLDLQTEARGITVDISISGTLNKLNITYRSDPPLQPRDIIALLTVGRAPDTASNIQNIQIANDTSGLQSGANSVLGQAMSPVSNRLSKLFGITNIKIDPLVQGITNTPQPRLTLEQQVSRDLTVTYVTNLSQTSEQIFRVEWSLSRQYSLVALRDENGEFGIDIQYKKRFK